MVREGSAIGRYKIEGTQPAIDDYEMQTFIGSGEENEALDEEVELNMMGVRRFNTMDTISEEEEEGIEEKIEEDIEFEEYYGEHKEDNRAEEDEE